MKIKYKISKMGNCLDHEDIPVKKQEQDSPTYYFTDEILDDILNETR